MITGTGRSSLPFVSKWTMVPQRSDNDRAGVTGILELEVLKAMEYFVYKQSNGNFILPNSNVETSVKIVTANFSGRVKFGVSRY